MKPQIRATNLEITPAIQSYIEKKMEMVEKFLGKTKVINCDFEIELTTKHHNKGEIFRAEVNLTIPGEVLWADCTADDLYKAIDKVKDHISDLIKKHKDKRLAKRRITTKKAS
ncbi:ribosome-associated translation inhibitor RaiA [Candidatus Falkowbacteria bacterium]|nr:MAG: ribosome-associated translation inhibitor RaiA [Candidatus Falkowbacteria bacterium]